MPEKSLWTTTVTEFKSKKKEEDMQYILATDVGSTTTKARLFGKVNGEWRYVVSGESPTTVEAPFENVCMGVINAVKEIEELLRIKILSSDNRIMTSRTGKDGVDFYCTTSSAGGGLQMMVAGVMAKLTAESANRAALGAGAIVMDIISVDDGRPDYSKIERVRNLRPDMVLLAGGTDGGTTELVMQIAELINAANPKPRLGTSYRLPLIYAGNKMLRNNIQELMKNNFEIEIVDNLRPTLEVENTEPARIAIHELFMEHVMSHAPGYTQLMEWTNLDIMPTPAGEGLGMQLIARVEGVNVMGVGLGGATTNIYSIVDGKFVRSVSANLGMSYSICNVLKEAGIDNITRWIPFDMDKNKIENILRNKMIRPTTIPQTLKMLMIEHAVAREALRLGMKHHKTIATRLKGAKQAERMIGEIMESQLQETYINMMNIDVLTGTGGLLSHAPKRAQTFQIIMDAWQPEGVTKLYQDSVFMMPHLGVLSTAYPEVAWNIFDKDCLVRLGTSIAPVGLGKMNDIVLRVKIEVPNGVTIEKEAKYGEIYQIPLPERVKAKATLSPSKDFDVGAGLGKSIEKGVEGGIVGIVIDARGRPLMLPEEDASRKEALWRWFGSMDLYPRKTVDVAEGGV